MAKTNRAKRVASISEDERRGLISEAAYYRALNRNFEGGDPMEDWLLAEQEVDNSLRGER